MVNLYGSNSTTAGLNIAQLTNRLDTLLLTLKACKGIVCRQPWQALFPSGDVQTLRDAMCPKYDEFFQNQPKVTFSACLYGQLLEYEGALTPNIYSSCA